MLGNVADAEDVVQEAYLRWQESREGEVRSPRSYLSAVVTRLSIDRMRSARARHEEYVGPWLPEPLVSEGAEDAGDSTELDESFLMAFLVLLESLDPVERAVPDLRCREGGEGPRGGASHGAAWFLRQSCADQWRTGRGRLRRRPLHGVVALDVAEDRIRGVRIVVNPDKLRAIP